MINNNICLKSSISVTKSTIQTSTSTIECHNSNFSEHMRSINKPWKEVDQDQEALTMHWIRDFSKCGPKALSLHSSDERSNHNQRHSIKTKNGSRLTCICRQVAPSKIWIERQARVRWLWLNQSPHSTLWISSTKTKITWRRVRHIRRW